MHGYRATLPQVKKKKRRVQIKSLHEKVEMRYDNVKQSFCQASSMGSCQGEEEEKGENMKTDRIQSVIYVVA